MRKWLLIGGTLAVLAVAFAMVIIAQRGLRIAEQAKTPTPAPLPAPTTQFGSVGQTQAASVVVYDKVTGLPLVRFRGEQFLPQPGDQMRVDQPQVEFFLGSDRSQVVRIVGKTGLVSMPGGGPRIRSNLTSTPVQPPTRGVMDDVVVTAYRTQQAAADNTPDLTLTLPKAYFDTELYELGTEEYVDASGKRIAAADVPVVVRGDEFEFDGEGLSLRWDQVGNRLKSLTIYKGDQLVIKRAPGRAFEPRTPAADSSKPAARPVAGKPKSGAPARAHRPAGPTLAAIFRATFHDGVKVTQADQTLATAYEMHVDFAEASADAPQPPIPAPRKSPAAPKVQKAAAGLPAPSAASAAKVVPEIASDEPIVIRWGGQMTVGPAPEEALKPQSADDAIVRFASGPNEPVTLYADGGTIEASWVAYQVQEQFAWVEGSPDRPVILTDAGKSVLKTPQLRYSREKGEVTLHGPSNADVNTEVDGQPQSLRASWQDLAVATISGPGDTRSVSRLVLKGQVKIENPQLKRFNAGALAIDFADGPADGAKRQVRQITASDSVDCVIVDSADKAKEQSIRAQRLRLVMDSDAAGKSYPARLVASGNVIAGDGTQQVKAQSIRAELDPPAGQQPATRPAGPSLAGLRQLIASGDVQLTGAKGESVKADRVQVKERASWIVLEGKPAVITQDQTTMSGAYIEVDTTTQKAVVTGGGSLAVAASQLASGAKTQPVAVTWLGDGGLDGLKNTANVSGNVLVKYTDSDGTQNEANCDRVDILLGEKPKEQTKTADSQRFATEKRQAISKAAESELGFMAGRFAKQLTLLASEGKDVRLQQLLPGPRGTIARQLNLLGMRVDCFLDEKQEVRRIEVLATPQRPGRFLYVALPVATRKPVKTADPLHTSNLAGATAFAWREKLIYDKSAGQIQMAGNVMIRHEPDRATPKAKGFQVDAQTITVDVADKTSAKAGSVEAMEVRQIVLRGNPVHLTSDDADLTAPQVQIDPATNTVFARGAGQEQVQVEKGRITGSFETVDLNTQSGEMHFKRGAGMGRQ